MKIIESLARPTLVTVQSLAFLLAGCMASGTADPSTESPVQATETSARGERPPTVEPVQTEGIASTIGVPAIHRATRLALTPLSSVRRTADGREAIDLRVDAFDDGGTRTRMAGEIRVVIRAKGCEPLYSAFDFTMLNRTQEAKHWDVTLEQYVLRVEPTWKIAPAEGARLEVTITLVAPSGSILETSGLIEWRSQA